MDIRAVIAIEVSKQIQASVLSQRCPRCDFPLMAKESQAMLPFCWGCVTDKRTAMEGRILLLRAQLKERGIFVVPESVLAQKQSSVMFEVV